MSFAVGSLVKARDREWVVLPDSRDDVLVLRPLGGTDEEVTGIFLPLEDVAAAQFGLPDASDPDQLGDYRSCKRLRDAIRLGFRTSSGPFRSFARLAVDPRPYQLVPLLMALKLDPVRLLIADDVGVGKTIEAGLIARELLDRGEVSNMTVLCPPHLAEQWQAELRSKFHIEAVLVLAGTARKLERNLAANESIFERHPFTVVSLDYIKSDRRRDDFLRACPDLIIVDEAHTCTYGGAKRGGRHQRHELLSRIADMPEKNMLLVTATPHSGNEDAFRGLLRFVNEEFTHLPNDLTGKENEKTRREVAKYFVQRRRADIRAYMDAETFFPERKEQEITYSLSKPYKALFKRVLDFARETIKDAESNKRRQRVRWWSALALLRCMGSSPAAAAMTLRSRVSAAEGEDIDAVDELGRRSVLDLDEGDEAERIDFVPGSMESDTDDKDQATHRRLLEMAREADALLGKHDSKLSEGVSRVKALLKDGYSPIVFCRYIPTAEYVANHLAEQLRGTEVRAVTGTLPAEERERIVEELGEAEKRVLVCTDCLSEGINLQDKFNAVIHYDLSWNPTRHEQREGRIDRYGQKKEEVRSITLYGIDNQIDGIVLDVLLRKHRSIRSSLGVSVPVPVDTTQVVEAIFEGLLLREAQGRTTETQMTLFEDFFKPKREDLYAQWENATAREKRSRTMFAQESIKVEDVALELKAVQQALGSKLNLQAFLKEAFQDLGASIAEESNDIMRVSMSTLPPEHAAVRDALPCEEDVALGFEPTVPDGVEYIQRTHPLVESLSGYVMDTALDDKLKSVAARTGVIQTKAVDIRTTVLLVRFRYHIITARGSHESPLLAEDCQVFAFRGSPEDPEWLEREDVEQLLEARPSGNVQPDVARHHLQRLIEKSGAIQEKLDSLAKSRGEELLDAHRRVRSAAKQKGLRYRVEPNLPPDLLGLYIYLADKPNQG